MRAKEFIVEQRAELPAEVTAPMRSTFILPGLPSQDPYKTYRFGVALARARGENSEENTHLPPFEAEGAFGEFATVSGFDDPSTTELIDTALKMTGNKGGKIRASTADSAEPDTVNDKSPVKAFKGYPR